MESSSHNRREPSVRRDARCRRTILSGPMAALATNTLRAKDHKRDSLSVMQKTSMTAVDKPPRGHSATGVFL